MPTRKPGYGAGNSLVTRFGGVDDMDNDPSYRLGDGDVAGFGTEDNKNKNRFDNEINPPAPPAVITLTDATRVYQPSDPNPNDSALSFELQSGGTANFVEQADSGGGPPDFPSHAPSTDWIIPNGAAAGPGVYHARWNQTGGGGTPDGGSSAENVWLNLTGGIIFGMIEGSVGSTQIVALLEISDDAGSTVLDSCTVDLTLDIQP